MSSPKRPTPLRRRRRGGSKPKLVSPAAAAVDSSSVDLAAEPEEEEQDDDLPTAAADLIVDIPPAEPAGTSFLDRAKATLGFASKEKDVEPKARPMSGKLTKGQQQFVDLAAPITCELGRMGASWTWGRIAGPDYAPYLTPDEEVASKIMLPLTRIMARLVAVQYKGKITPNGIDAAASLAALVGYAMTSWQMYTEIKQEEQRYGTQPVTGQEANSSSPVGGQPVRSKRQAAQNAASHLPEHGHENEAALANGGNIRGDQHNAGSADLRTLTPAERQQYEALARLRNQDYQSRLRRSGIA